MGASPAAMLKQARLAAGLSQRELARRAGVHQPQVVRAEHGEDVQLSLLARLAQPLGLQPGLMAAVSQQHHDAIDSKVGTWRAAWPQVDPEVFAILTRLARAGRHVDADIERTAALHGMTGREIIVLGSLRRKGPPFEATPGELKQLLWLSLPGLKKRLDRLVELGMVTRASNPRDGRSSLVRLTARGHAALDDLVSHPQALVYRALIDMSPAERATLSSLLRELLGRIDDDASR
jgi:DNA-binding MarR family transcriptional regulator/DNA-binding XRE family transcriptional regulator